MSSQAVEDYIKIFKPLMNIDFMYVRILRAQIYAQTLNNKSPKTLRQ